MKHYDGSVEFQGYYVGPVAPGFPAGWWSPHTITTLQKQLWPPSTVIYPVFGFQNSPTFQATAAYVSVSNLGVMQVFGTDLTGLVAGGSAPNQFTMNFRYMAQDSRPLPAPGFPVSFTIKSNTPPAGVIPIASVDLSQDTVRPGPMLANADWEFSRNAGASVVKIKNLSFSGFNNRIKAWFLVIYR